MAKELIKDGVHDFTTPADYIYPTDETVKEHIKWFTGLKLGLMMHWSPGSQLGTFESWPILDETWQWSQKDIDWTDDIDEFREQYINSSKTFNPIKFRPDKWAKLAKDCGFKYLLFTTKHHDGFCMFDTKTTDYKITDKSCPFSTNKYSNIVKCLYDEFRKQGLAISTYFSKPDWHSNYFWNNKFPKYKVRSVNYNIKQYPEIWDNFVKYVHEQITELTTNYGKIDVLWLDGGWVNANNKNQDIKLEELVQKIRSTTQPHLIVCDRTVGGKYENIITPEQNIPDKPITVPWESCISLGDYFSFHYDDNFKSAHTLVHMLVDIVSKGGNLALNITPQPDGNLPSKAIQSMRGLGNWLSINGEGIYNTTICQNSIRNISYTQNDNSIYAFYLYDQVPFMPNRVQLIANKPIKDIILLRTNQHISFKQESSTLVLDTSDINMLQSMYCDCFKLEYK